MAMAEVEPPTPIASDGRRSTRRNSSIMSEAWQSKPPSPIDSTEPEGGGQGQVRAAGDEELTSDGVVVSLSRMVKDLERIINARHLLASDQMLQLLEKTRADLLEVHNSLEFSGKMAKDSRDDVEALLELEQHPWNFDNVEVDSYRASTAHRSYGDWAYRQWHFPQYISRMPIPHMDNRMVIASVKLPKLPGCVQHPDTNVELSEVDTWAYALAQAFSKITDPNILRIGKENFVLKAVGTNEYFDSSKKAFNYAYVRQRVRDGLGLSLCVVRAPELLADPEGTGALQERYRQRIKPGLYQLQESHYQKMDAQAEQDFTQLTHIPLRDLRMPFRLKINGLANLDEQNTPRLFKLQVVSLFVSVVVFHGTRVLGVERHTEAMPMGRAVRWYQWLQPSPELLLCRLPRESRIGVFLRGSTATGEKVDLAWSVLQLVDRDRQLLSGPLELKLWEFPGKDAGKHAKKEREDPQFLFRQTTRDNCAARAPCTISVALDEYMLPVVAPLEEAYRPPDRSVVGAPCPPPKSKDPQSKRLAVLIKADSLFELTAKDQALLWEFRHALLTYPRVLPKLLQSVPWDSPEHRLEARRLLKLWAPPESMTHVLELLEAKYANYSVRRFAVECLREIGDEELQSFLLQFTQCLKFEPYHDSPLSRFLIERAIRSPYAIGHYFFWHLKAELHVPQFAERYGVILEEYLSHCGRYAQELRKQHTCVLKLQRVAAMIVRLKREEGYGDKEATVVYHKELHKLNAELFGPQGKFIIPLDPKLEATTLMVDKCRFMSSKMVPLWLVFKNADETAPPIFIMFKSGDDLRQDILTLQILRMMDRLWLAEGLNMKLRPYKCIATGVNDHGEGVGLIEIVLNSDTTSGIQLKYGGGAQGALRLDPIDLFLREHNKGTSGYAAAVDNFVCSCAGYCVATFVLGIGDRHNGNIMVTKDGHLFHIDFGHFLGNFKKKFGFNRERAAFVFTKEMAYVMGGKNYKSHALFKRFIDLCQRSYAVLRDNASIVEILFMLMVNAGMPELMVEQDIMYMREKLHLEDEPKKADKKLKDEIKKSLSSTYRRVDNFIHNYKHG